MVDGGGPFSFKNAMMSGDNLLGSNSPSAMADAYLSESFPMDVKKGLFLADEKPPYLDGLAFSFKRQQALLQEKSPPRLSGSLQSTKRSSPDKRKGSP